MSEIGILKNERYIQVNATIRLKGYTPIDVLISRDAVSLKQHNSRDGVLNLQHSSSDDIRILKTDIEEFINSLQLLLADSIL